MLKKAIVITALVTGLGAGHVMAQPPGGPGGFTPPSFADYDKDKNGKVTKEEIAAYIAARAAAAPGGGGGGGGGRPPQNPDDILGRWDTNKDGSVTQAEFDARPRGGPGGGAGGPPGGGAGGPPK